MSTITKEQKLEEQLKSTVREEIVSFSESKMEKDLTSFQGMDQIESPNQRPQLNPIYLEDHLPFERKRSIYNNLLSSPLFVSSN